MNGPSGTKEFHIGAVLTITDGKVVAPGMLDDIYGILNWMTGDNLFTHQLGRASDECQPALAEQFPQLAAEVVPEGLDTIEKVMAYLKGLYPKYGETVFVAPLDPADHTSIDPVAEAIMRFPHAAVIEVAEPPEDDQ